MAQQQAFLDSFHELGAAQPERRCRAAFQICRHPGGEADRTYTVTRLVRGLTSDRAAARQGFATALAELLRRAEKPDFAVQLLDTAERQFETMKKADLSSERDLVLAQLFLQAALLRSGARHDAATEERIFEKLHSLSKSRSYLAEPCAREALEYLQSKLSSSHGGEHGVLALVKTFVTGSRDAASSTTTLQEVATAATNVHHVGVLLELGRFSPAGPGGEATGKSSAFSSLNWVQQGKLFNSLLHHLLQDLRIGKENYTNYRPWYFAGVLRQLFDRSDEANLEAAAKKLFDTVAKALETSCSSKAASSRENGGKEKDGNKWSTSGAHGTRKALELLQICFAELSEAKFGAAALPTLFASHLMQVFCGVLGSSTPPSNPKGANSAKKCNHQNANKQLANALLAEIRKSLLPAPNGEPKGHFAVADPTTADHLFLRAHESLAGHSTYRKMPPRLQRALSQLLLNRLSGEKLQAVASGIVCKVVQGAEEPEALCVLTAHPRCTLAIQKAVLGTFLCNFAAGDFSAEQAQAVEGDIIGGRGEEAVESSARDMGASLAKRMRNAGSCRTKAADSKSGSEEGAQKKAAEEAQRTWRTQFWKLLGQVLKKASTPKARRELLQFVHLFAAPATATSQPQEASQAQAAEESLTKRVEEVFDSFRLAGGATKTSDAVLQLLLAMQCVRRIDRNVSNEKMDEIVESLLEKVKLVEEGGKKSKKKSKDQKTISKRKIEVDVEGLTEELPHVYAETVGFVKDAVADCWAALVPELFGSASDSDEGKGAASDATIEQETLAASFDAELAYTPGAAVADSPAMQVLLGLCFTLRDDKTAAAEEVAENDHDASSDEEMSLEVPGKPGQEMEVEVDDDDDDEEEAEKGEVAETGEVGDGDSKAGMLVQNSFNEIAVADGESLLTLLTEDDANDEMTRLAESFGVKSHSAGTSSHSSSSSKDHGTGPTAEGAKTSAEAVLKQRMGNLVKQIKYLDLIGETLDWFGSKECAAAPGRAHFFALDVLQQLFDALCFANKRSAKLQAKNSAKGQEKAVTQEATMKLKDVVKRCGEKILRKIADADVRSKFVKHVVDTCRFAKMKLPALFEAGAGLAVAAARGAGSGPDRDEAAVAAVDLQETIESTVDQWLRKDDTHWAPTFLKAIADRSPARFTNVDWLAKLNRSEGVKLYNRNEVRAFVLTLVQKNRELDFVSDLSLLALHCTEVAGSSAKVTKKIEQACFRDLVKILEFIRDHREENKSKTNLQNNLERVKTTLSQKKEALSASKNKIYMMACQAEKIIERILEGGKGDGNAGAGKATDVAEAADATDEAAAAPVSNKRPKAKQEPKVEVVAGTVEDEQAASEPPKKKKKKNKGGA